MSLAGVFLQNDSWNKSNHLTITLWMLMQFLMHFLLFSDHSTAGETQPKHHSDDCLKPR